MSIVIKTLRNNKVISNLIFKEIKKLIKEKSEISIGLYYDQSIDFLIDFLLKKQKKIKYSNISFVQLAEYEGTNNLENELKDIFLSKIKLKKDKTISFAKISEKIQFNDDKNFWTYSNNEIDLLIFPISSNGIFLFNDDSSNISFVNKSKFNQKDVVSLGIKSIIKANKIITIATDNNSEEVIEYINKKDITSNHFYSLLNIHEDICLYTTKNLFKKKKINKNIFIVDDELIISKVNDPNFVGPLKKSNSENDNFYIPTQSVDEIQSNDNEPTKSESEQINENTFIVDNEKIDSEQTNHEITIETDESKELTEEEFKNDFEFKLTNDDFDIKNENYTNLNGKQIQSPLFKDPNLEYLNNIDLDKDDEVDEFKNIPIIDTNENNIFENVPIIETNQNVNESSQNEELNYLNELKNQLENDVYNLENKNNLNKETNNFVEIDGQIYEFTYADETKPIDTNQLSNKTNFPSFSNKPQLNLDDDNCTIEELENINKIKEETLKMLDLLIKNNRLLMEKQIIKSNDVNLNNENKIDEFSDLITLTYSPGIRPTPLLMYETYPDINAYDRIVVEMVENYKTNMNAKMFNYSKKHMWNMGAYISYDEDTYDTHLFAFSEFSNMLYLLRQINKPLKIKIRKENYRFIIDSLNQLSDEIQVSF